METISVLPPHQASDPAEASPYRRGRLSPKGLAGGIIKAAKIPRKDITNKINFLHFMEESVLLQSFDPVARRTRLIRTFPGPCIGDKVVCSLSRDLGDPLPLSDQSWLYLIMNDGRSVIVVPVILHAATRTSLEIGLPGEGYVLNDRRSHRLGCRGLTARLTLGRDTREGTVLDFSPVGFRVRIPSTGMGALRGVRAGGIVRVQMHRGGGALFSGACRCLRRRDRLFQSDIVLEPLGSGKMAGDGAIIRNPRQSLTPPPTLAFEHPFFDRKVRLQISDISTAGICVHEKPGEGLLAPGMILPDLAIDFVGCRRLHSRAKVIYRRDEGKRGVRCGLAILDMDIEAYSQLAHILTNALDSKAYVSGEVDMEDLWRFFFESGFIYPKKYRLIQANRNRFKETYRRLYEESPGVARHFTYQENGRISGHISMIRSYKTSWMIQHHAAITTGNRRAGFMVLNQIMQFLQDIHRMPSAKTDYVMCYFRRENRFPDRVFGGFARELNDPRACSLDGFSYLPHTTLSLRSPLPEGWVLEEGVEGHTEAIRRFYRTQSGGLLLDVLKLEQGEDRFLEDLYGACGLLRRWSVYALTYRGLLNAMLIADESNQGVNLSELLNGIKILITNPDGLPWKVLSSAIGRLAARYAMDKVPVLISPSEYASSQGIPFEKEYLLWIYDIRNVGRFKVYLKERFRIPYWQ